MAVPQITVRLPQESKEAFEAYAFELGLDASELAKLLIVRERRLRRLAAHASQGNLPSPQRQPRGAAVPKKTITAHVSMAQVTEFDAYAQTCGLSRGNAGAWLLLAELSEKWLERALSQE